MQFDQMESAAAIDEAERLAWVSGNRDQSAVLAALADRTREIEQFPDALEKSGIEGFEEGKQQGAADKAAEIADKCEDLIGELLDHSTPLRKARRLEIAAKLAEILL